MTGNKIDPRVVKTRNSLRKALVYLMKHDKLENISVQKITETANITRGTFYLHYKDKRDFIKSAIDEILDEFFDQVMIEKHDPETGTTFEVFSLNEAFQTVEENAEVFDVLLNTKQGDFFYQQLADRLSQNLFAFAKHLASDSDDVAVPVKIQVSFLTAAVLGVISSWLKDDMIYTPRYMTQSMTKLLNKFSGQAMLLTAFFDGSLKSKLDL